MFDGDPASPEADRVHPVSHANRHGGWQKRKRTRRNTLRKSIKRIDVMNIKRLVDSLVRKYKSRNPFEIIEHLKCSSCLLSLTRGKRILSSTFSVTISSILMKHYPTKRNCLFVGMSWVTCSCTRKRMQSSWTLGRNSILLSTK